MGLAILAVRELDELIELVLSCGSWGLGLGLRLASLLGEEFVELD